MPVGSSGMFDVPPSQEIPELFLGQAGVAYDSAHRESVHRIMAWNRDDSLAVGHDDVLRALTSDPETDLLERPHGAPVRYASNLRHGSNRDVDFANLAAAKLRFNDCEVLSDRIGNVFQCLFLRRSLRPTAWEARNRYGNTLIALLQPHSILHGNRIPLLALPVERLPSPARVFVRARWKALFGLCYPDADGNYRS
jgi:hypothetical protein